MSATVEALVATAYGPVRDVLRHADVPRDEPGAGQVLVRSAAVSLNAADVLLTHGEPLLVRAGFGLRRPRRPVRGRDLAGTVVAVGPGVTAWSVGDRVAGEVPGSLARAVVAPADALARVPDGVTLADAATVPLAGATARQALRAASVGPGSRVLVTGASGGVGGFVVQLARAVGADVVGECSAAKADVVRAAGAEPLERGAPLTAAGFDAVVDVGGGRSLGELRRAVRPGGAVVLTSGRGGRVIGPMGRLLAAVVTSPFVAQRLRPLAANVSSDDVAALLADVAAGRVRPLVGTVLPFERAVDAFALLEAGAVRGKVVVTLDG